MQQFLKAQENLTSTEYEIAAMRWLSETRSTLAAKTISRHMCSLKAFAKANEIAITRLNTYRLPPPPPPRPHPLPEGLQGVVMMLAAANCEEHRVMIGLCGLAGLRISEALSMRASMIDPVAKMIRIQGKGEKIREVPISARLWRILEMPYYKSYVDNDRLLIPIGNRTARKAISSIGTRAGLVRHVASHDLRATFATSVLKRTHDIILVQRLLGHSSVATTMTYLGVSKEEFASGVDL